MSDDDLAPDTLDPTGPMRSRSFDPTWRPRVPAQPAAAATHTSAKPSATEKLEADLAELRAGIAEMQTGIAAALAAADAQLSAMRAELAALRLETAAARAEAAEAMSFTADGERRRLAALVSFRARHFGG